jgi:hypothetical protein
MDVHAPHGAMHSWKDFWVHLGTITIVDPGSVAGVKK